MGPPPDFSGDNSRACRIAASWLRDQGPVHRPPSTAEPWANVQEAHRGRSRRGGYNSGVLHPIATT
jgi:hypothetical protein